MSSRNIQIDVSIIIPVYNAEKYLRKCLDSFINPNHKIEVILVDDGSTDSSPKICDEYASRDSRFSVIHCKNSGPSHARNQGIDKAVGKWISFIDADDWIDETYFDIINEAESADIIYFGYNSIKATSSTSHKICVRNYDTVDDVLTMLIKSKERFFGFTVNKFFRRELIVEHNLRFREDLIIKEDEEFCVRYCKYIKSIHLSNATPYYYRISSYSTSNAKRKDRNRAELAVYLEKDLSDYPHKSFKKQLLNKIYWYWFEAVIESYQTTRINNILNWDAFYQRNMAVLNTHDKLHHILNIPFRGLRLLILKSIIHLNIDRK